MSRTPNPRCTDLIATAREVLKHLPDTDIRSAFLFGSAAWGDADEASDLDIMLLLDRPASYREVTRVRLADLFGHPLASGPVFADLDRVSAEGFADIVEKGGAGHRLAHSVILADTNGFFERLRDSVMSEFLSPAAREARVLKKREQAEAHRAAARAAAGRDDDLAALHSRLALEGAGATLIELNDDRLSVTHYVDSVERALLALDAGRLFEPFLQALALDAPLECADRSRRAYDAFANALRGWMADHHIRERLSQEDLAWAEFTYGEQTYEEIHHKVAALQQPGRTPRLLYYLDGLLMVPIRINVGKIFLLRATGAAGRMSIPDFQVALRAELALYEHWVSGLRLGSLRNRVQEADDLAAQLLGLGDTRPGQAAPGAPRTPAL